MSTASPGPGVRPSPKPSSPRASKAGVAPVRTGGRPRKDASPRSPKSPMSPTAETPNATPPESPAQGPNKPTSELALLLEAVSALTARCDKMEATNAALEAKVTELEADAEATSQTVYELGKKAAAAAVATSQAVGSINKTALRQSASYRESTLAGAGGSGAAAAAAAAGGGGNELELARLASLEHALKAVKEVSDAAFNLAKSAQQTAEKAAAGLATVKGKEAAALADSPPPQLAEQHSTHFSATMELGSGDKPLPPQPTLSSNLKPKAAAEGSGQAVVATSSVPVLKARAEAAAATREKMVSALRDDREEWEKALDGDGGNGIAEAKASAEAQGTALVGGGDSEGGGGGLSLRERLALRRGSTRDGRVLTEVDAKVAEMEAAEAAACRSEARGNRPTPAAPVLPPPSPAAAAAAAAVAANPKALALSEEEKAMNGAPEGELFAVEVLTREELPSFGKGNQDAESGAFKLLAEVVAPVLNPQEEDGGADCVAPAWNLQFEALTALRRVLAHFPAALDATKVRALLPSVARCAHNLRSVLAKNALLCCDDLFHACRTADSPTANTDGLLNTDANATAPPPRLTLLGAKLDVEVLVGCLLDACASNSPKALRLTAADALLSATTSVAASLWVSALLVPCLAARSAHKNKDVAEKAMVFTHKVLEGFASLSTSGRSGSGGGGEAVQDTATATAEATVVDDVGGLLRSLSAGLSGKTAEGKRAARACCGILQGSFFDNSAAAFAAAVDKLGEAPQLAEIGGSEGGQEEGGGKLPTPSPLTALQISELKAAAEGGLKQEEAGGATSKTSAASAIGKKGVSSIKSRMAQLRKSKVGSAAGTAVPEEPK